MDCLPSCTSPDNPFQYEPMTYADYMGWYTSATTPARRKP